MIIVPFNMVNLCYPPCNNKMLCGVLIKRGSPVLLKSGLMTYATQKKTNENKDILSFDAIPGPKGIYRWPVLGSLLLYKPFTKYTADHFDQMMTEMFRKYGPVVRLNLGQDCVAICDPKDFETVYRNEGKYPNRPGVDIMSIYCQRNGIKDELAQLQGDEWHAVRTHANKKLMMPESPLLYLQPQNEVADDLVEILETKMLSPKQLQDLLLSYAAESIAVVIFNKRLGLLRENPKQDYLDFVEATKTALDVIQDVAFGKSLLHRWFKNSTYRKFEKALNTMRRVNAAEILEARNVLEDKIRSGYKKVDEPSLLYSLLAKKNLTDEDISNLLQTLFGAGTDSTAKNLQVFLYNLAKNPSKQEKLRQEILDNIGSDGPLTSQSLNKIVYLKACLKESNRLIFPVSAGTSRILPVEVILGKYRVPPGVRILINHCVATKKYFENPDVYLPERWLRSEETVQRDSAHHLIVMPFSHGGRNCIGKRFALQEIYLATAKILQKFHVGVDPESLSTKFIYKTFIEPEKPIKFKFTKLGM